MKRILSICVVLCACLFFAGCTGDPDNSNTTITTSVDPPQIQKLVLVPRPQRVLDQMKQRGEEERAQPILQILSPTNASFLESSTVIVRLKLSGDLKGYEPHKDSSTGTGNHIHVILDDGPYEAYYDLSQPFELKNVAPGKHLLRVFASRPWHESYKNDGSLQMTTFTVKAGGDTSKPTTKGMGETLADNNSKTAEESVDVDLNKPLLTYSRPKGEYKGADADPIMLDFWLSNAKLKGDGGDYRVRYIIDDDEPRFIDKWEPIWLSGWISGKHTVRLELLGPDQYPVPNGAFNVTTREIIVMK